MNKEKTTYDFSQIEAKWQRIWQEQNTFKAGDCDRSRCKYYVLIEFPYPSSQGLHVGHPRSYSAMDVIARKRRQQGYNVLFPIGWDSFGLPAENYAIKTGVHPDISTRKNIENFKRQLKMLGLSFDWSREISTSDPSYYKWTQWMFLRLFERGLAYKAEVPINWCTSCKVGLANEEVLGGMCERCGSAVVRKMRKQWMLRITKYAERLIDDLQPMDYLDRIKTQQVNWIGRSLGAEVEFAVEGFDEKIRVFTTRPDTLFGATYMVLAPEHPLVDVITTAERKEAVEAYRAQTAGKSDLDRTDLSKAKTGEPTGAYAINPVNNKKIPIWISDYVLISYGTGAIMAVPAHDERDFEFAKKFDLPIVPVVEPPDGAEAQAVRDKELCFAGEGKAINSGSFNGLPTAQFKERITEWLEEKGLGKKAINYKLRDWLFSRQRYWGEPIPLVRCEKCGWVPIDESELPLLLPEIKEFKPSKTGDSLLADLKEWVSTTCPRCGGPAERETDTMPQWAGSCWYFLRYTDPENTTAFASKEALDYWMPVDWYNGGMEHTTLHLLYSRFWHKFLYDEGLVSCSEPYSKRTSHGMILGSDNEKMSKSRGNVVNPDDVVRQYGADTFRVYEMFIGAFDQAAPWSTQGMIGGSRFLNKVWNLLEKVDDTAAIGSNNLRLMHRTIMRVTSRIESMKFNTAISEIIYYTHELFSMTSVAKEMYEILCRLLYPFAPHICEELWERLGHSDGLTYQPWPQHDEQLAKEEEIELAVQVNGKIRDKIVVPADSDEEHIKTQALQSGKTAAALAGKEPKRIIVVKSRLVNIVC